MEKNSEPSKTFTHMVKWFLTKVVKIIQWGKDSIPQNGAGRTWQPHAKEWGSVQLSHSVVSDSLRPRGLQHARPSRSSPTPGVYTNSSPLSWWCHPTVSSSVDPFSSHLQSFPASGSFPMKQLSTSGGQSIGVSDSASILPKNIQNGSPWGWTGWISLQSKGLSRVCPNTTVQKHQFSGAQLSLQSNSHIPTWLLEKPQLWLDGPLLAKECLCFSIWCLGWS